MCLYRKSRFLHKGLLQQYFQIQQRIISIYTINRAMFSGSIKASLQNTGYPLAIALSSDATRLLASYLCMDGSTVKTRVISYNFSDTQSKHVIDTLELEELYPKIEFLENNKAVMFGEKSFVLYNTDTKRDNFSADI